MGARRTKFSGYVGKDALDVDGETWFTIADSYQGETVWYEVRCAEGPVGTLALTVTKGDLVTVGGLAEDRGYKKLGRWKQKWILWATYLGIPGGERAGDPGAVPEHSSRPRPTTPAEPTPEEEYAQHVKRLDAYPLRWERPGWDKTAGGSVFWAEHPELIGEGESRDLSPVAPEQIRQFVDRTVADMGR